MLNSYTLVGIILGLGGEAAHRVLAGEYDFGCFVGSSGIQVVSGTCSPSGQAVLEAVAWDSS